MIYVKVTIIYRDDKKSIFKCSDTPSISQDWVTLYPIESPMSRKNIPSAGVKEISYTYEYEQ